MMFAHKNASREWMPDDHPLYRPYPPAPPTLVSAEESSKKDLEKMQHHHNQVDWDTKNKDDLVYEKDIEDRKEEEEDDEIKDENESMGVLEFEKIRARSERIQSPRLAHVVDRGEKSLRSPIGPDMSKRREREPRGSEEEVEMSPIIRERERDRPDRTNMGMGLGDSNTSFDIMTPKTFVSGIGSE